MGQTDAEKILWASLRNRSLDGLKFRRQHRIGSFIIDFYSASLRLGIELDGDPHFTEQGRRYDALREAMLAEEGIRIIQFENCEVVADPASVIRNLESVIAEIRAAR